MAQVALTIAGSDSGGGAGIQADLKTFSARGVFGTSALTAITAQNLHGVTAVAPVSNAVVAAQIAAVLDDFPVAAIKIGMLGGAQTVVTVADALAGYSAPIIVDPVMVAKSGDRLLDEAALDALRARLVPRAALLTPNLPEAADLLGVSEAASPGEIIAQGRALCAMGAAAVLMKGGHAAGPDCVDRLVTAQDVIAMTSPRIHTRNTHGTGCTLSSAIAAELAKGEPLADAVRAMHVWLHGAIRAADSLAIATGTGGHGPVHHFHEVWT